MVVVVLAVHHCPQHLTAGSGDGVTSWVVSASFQEKLHPLLNRTLVVKGSPLYKRMKHPLPPSQFIPSLLFPETRGFI